MLNPVITPTPNIGFGTQAYGSNIGAWGVGVTDPNWILADSQLGGFLTLNISGGTDIVLTDDQAAYSGLRFTGTLTSNISVIVPNRGRQYWVWCDIASNGFMVTLLPYLGTGIQISSGEKLQIRIDPLSSTAINFTPATSLPSPVPISQGGTGATTAAGARTNLGLGAAAVENLGGPVIDDGSGNLTLDPSPATAILNPFIGDTSTGGTKGLVPAPAAGYGAAGRVLRADGTWGFVAASTITGLGTAAFKAVTNNSYAAVASVTGTFISGHVAVFADTGGSITDGGVLGTAAAKAASNNASGTVASVSGTPTVGHLAIFTDSVGTVGDGGATSGFATSGINTNITALNGLGLRAVTANTTVTASDQVLEVDATSGAVTVTYPLGLVASGKAKIVKVVKTDTSDNFVNISDGTNTVYVLTNPANGAQCQACDVYSNQSALRIV